MILLCALSLKANTVGSFWRGWHYFYWLEHSDVADCVCGISYNDKPIGVGVFFDLNLVLTSATAIEPYVDKLELLAIHSIDGAYNSSWSWEVTCAIPSYPAKRRDYWHPLGIDGKHSAIHDLMVLFAKGNDSYDLAPEAVNASYRHAFSSHLATWNHTILPRGFLIPGFGFVDKDHVRSMDVMEMEVYDEAVLVDCDDYIPRDWGRFICIANKNNSTGVQSGSPLIQKQLVYGIGSFALEKGEDKILVFTDVRDYITNLHYCLEPGDQIEWKSRYWKH